MNKLLVISGPTATGKTDLAAKLAKKYNGELISADSRQVYKGMDIGTGKDHPKNIKIHLIDILEPSKTFSAAEYKKIAIQTIKKIQNKNKLPLLVGGTGFYIDSVLGRASDTYDIKPNPFLRKILSFFPISGLQKIYSTLDKNTYLSLNNSEKHNPHRLIRKIEIKLSGKFNPDNIKPSNLKNFDILHISLTAPNLYVYHKIDQRIDSRLNQGLLVEIENLLKHYSWSNPGLKTIAYIEFLPYFKNKTKDILDKCVEKWKYDEHRLAKRQKTWFKKAKNTKIIDITSKNHPKNVLGLVEKWYNTP